MALFLRFIRSCSLQNFDTNSLNHHKLFQDWSNEPLPATLHSETRQKTSFQINPARTKLGGFGAINRYQRSPSPQRGRKRNSGKDSDNAKGKKARGSSPDFGGNPNCVPLGPSKRGIAGASPAKFGGRGMRAARGGAAGGLLTSKNRKGKF